MKFESRYSTLDKVLHTLAFSTIEIQKGLADLEDRVYADRLAEVKVDRPVFITSLPRAGTTLLLGVIASTGSFGSHTYRDLPFLLIPFLWNTVSRGGRSQSRSEIERAHGDGITIGYDSEEAFEEVLWLAYWQHKYLEDRILTWEACDQDRHGEFDDFFKSHLRKLLFLKGAARYVSKNNANISRIRKLLAIFPDAQVLVPFRSPVDQAVSMWRQHLNFTQIHEVESFTRRYMGDIGHFDFGANLRPIDFDGWLDADCPESPDEVGFWLRYWCAAFKSLLEMSALPHVYFVNYDRLCDEPVTGLSCLSDMLEATDLDVPTQADRFRPSNSYELDALELPQELYTRASTVYSELKKIAIN